MPKLRSILVVCLLSIVSANVNAQCTRLYGHPYGGDTLGILSVDCGGFASSVIWSTGDTAWTISTPVGHTYTCTAMDDTIPLQTMSHGPVHFVEWEIDHGVPILCFTGACSVNFLMSLDYYTTSIFQGLSCLPDTADLTAVMYQDSVPYSAHKITYPDNFSIPFHALPGGHRYDICIFDSTCNHMICSWDLGSTSSLVLRNAGNFTVSVDTVAATLGQANGSVTIDNFIQDTTVNLGIPLNASVQFRVVILDSQGQALTPFPQNSAHSVTFNTLSPGNYFAEIHPDPLSINYYFTWLPQTFAFAISSSMSTGMFDAENYNIQVYPNPASDEVQVKSNTKFIKVSIYDLLGQLLTQKEFVGKECSVNVQHLDAGTYILIAEDESNFKMSNRFHKN